MDAAALYRFYQSLSHMPDLGYPYTRGIPDYKGAFKSYLPATPELNDLVEFITIVRTDLSQLMVRPGFHVEKLKLVDDYLPLITRLMDSLIAAQTIQADKALVFEWKPFLGGGNNTGPAFRSSDIIFEVIMMLHFKGITHYNYARAILDGVFSSGAELTAVALTDSGKQLMLAAGVFDYIDTNIRSGAWHRMYYSHPGTVNPPETTPAMSQALSLYMRMMAQTLAYLKTVLPPIAGQTPAPAPPSPLVKSRLAVGAYNLSKLTLQTILDSPYGGSGKLATFINIDWINHIGCMREVYTVIAYFQNARVLREKDDIGNTLGYVNFAKTHLSEQPKAYSFLSAGLPKLPASPPVQFIYLKPIVTMLLFQLTDLFNEADRHNRFVTFQTTPTRLEELPALPAEAVIVKSTPCLDLATLKDSPGNSGTEGANTWIIEFKLPEKKGFLSSLFGFGGKKDSVSATRVEIKEDAAAAATVSPSDAPAAAVPTVASTADSVAPPQAPANQVGALPPLSVPIGYAPTPASPPFNPYSQPSYSNSAPYQPTQPQPQAYSTYQPQYQQCPQPPTNGGYPTLAPHQPTYGAPMQQPQYQQYQPQQHQGHPAMSDEDYARQLQQQFNTEFQQQQPPPQQPYQPQQQQPLPGYYPPHNQQGGPRY